MIIDLDTRLSDLPFVHAVYQARSIGGGSFLSNATTQWEMVITKQAGNITLSLRGPETKASPAPIPEDAEFLGIIFRHGTFMPRLPGHKLVDEEIHLSETGRNSFQLFGESWEFPNFENVDTFVGRLIRKELVAHDQVVDDVLNGRTQDLSLRSIQRRFLHVTGLTYSDCYGRRAHIAESPDWEILFRQFREPAYAWLIADRKTRTPQALFCGVIDLPPAPPPAQESKLWPEMGYVALRSSEGKNYWSGKGWSVFATFSGQPVHENADKLSIILFADGHLWLPDCEARTSAEHAFSSATQGQLNRSTVGHNTLSVDNRSQRSPGARWRRSRGSARRWCSPSCRRR